MGEGVLQRLVLLRGSMQGVILSIVVGVIAHNVASLPLFSVAGPMVIAILVGMVWRLIIKP
ncbi:hypothetical protein [Ammonifex degensii]|uniref:hypothetical protein n=1 Tax=Ammonifex degensii TaxID=42838 RepID=UPI0012EA211F|nr:hypothetical protein [Ammonifex degensii]